MNEYSFRAGVDFERGGSLYQSSVLVFNPLILVKSLACHRQVVSDFRPETENPETRRRNKIKNQSFSFLSDGGLNSNFHKSFPEP